MVSRSLSPQQKHQSAVEREAMAIIEAVRKWSSFIKTFRTIIKTDQRSVSYIYPNHSNKIKNEKIIRWRLELLEYQYEIQYRKGSSNIPADSLSRVAAMSSLTLNLKQVHNSLAHPGISRMWEYVQRHNLAFTLNDIRQMTQSCKTCLECKPKFHKPPLGKIIRATRPFERLGIDIVGPKEPSAQSQSRYLFTVIDEYSRFPFAFCLKSITSDSIIKCLKQLFAIFGTPQFIHSDRGTQFLSNEFENFCLQAGIAHSSSTPYHPTGNGQTERFNGIIWRSIQCLLHSESLSQSMWEEVLPQALSANRSLICTATNESQHARMFSFERRGSLGFSIPNWLRSGQNVYVRNFVRSKDDPLVTPASVIQVSNAHYAKIKYANGREDTVSTSSLAPGLPIQSTSAEENSEQVEQEYTVNDVSTKNQKDTDTERIRILPKRNRRPPERLIDTF